MATIADKHGPIELPKTAEEHAVGRPCPKVRPETVRSAVAIFVLSAVAGCALAFTLGQPDRHPMICALALSWLIAVASGAITNLVFRRGDATWFRLARWEREGRVYEWIGLGIFRWILLHTPLHWLGPDGMLRSGRSDLERLLRDLHPGEAAHLIAAILSLAVAAVYILTGHAALATWMVLITIPLNIYPVILLRWVRGRILRLQRRLDAAKQTSRAPQSHLIGDQR